MQAVIYLKHNGEILRAFEGHAGMLDLQVQPGEAYVEGVGDWKTHVVRDGRIYPLSKPRTPPSPYHVWDRNNAAWVDPRNIDQMREDRWTEIKQDRDVLEEGTFTWRTHVFQMTYGLRSALALYMAVAQTDKEFTVELTDDGNAQVVLSASDILDLGKQYAVWLNGLHSRSQEVRRKLERASVTTANKLTL